MAYLDNSSITVDAVLTKKGRELLSKGGTAFKITKFALSDDEIDYSLWNPVHPSGSDYYGKVIENMPVLEALIDESQAMRYKLISIDDVLSTATTVNLPYVELKSSTGGTITNGSTVNISLTDGASNFVFEPSTNYVLNGITQYSGLDSISDGAGYTFLINKAANNIITDSKGMFTNLANQFVGIGSELISGTVGQFSGDGDFTAVSRIGGSLSISPNSVGLMSENVTFTLPVTVIGNQSGVIFNIILSFSVPSALTSIIGSGISRGGQPIRGGLPPTGGGGSGFNRGRPRESMGRDMMMEY